MNTALELDLSHMQPGFADPVHNAQRSFRCVLDAFSHPGRLFTMPVAVSPPEGLPASICAILLALADHDTPVWLPADMRNAKAGHYLRFHCGCRLAETLADAHFVVPGSLAELPAHDALRLGEPAYPDRSATLLIEVPELAEGGPIRLRGPGIAGTREIAVAGWSADTSAFLHQNRVRFPLGADLLLVCGWRIMGLPRTSLVES